MLDRLGINANYIRADKTYLQFSSDDSALVFSYADMLKKSVSLPRGQGDAGREEGSSIQTHDEFTETNAEDIIDAILWAMFGDQSNQTSTSRVDPPVDTDPLLDESGNSSIAHEDDISNEPHTHTECSDVAIDSEEQSISLQGAYGPLVLDEPIEPHASNIPSDRGLQTETLPTNTEDSPAQNPQCPFCSVAIEDSDSTATLTERGVTGIMQAAKKRGDDLKVVVGQKIHQDCRRTYIHPKTVGLVVRKRVERERSESPTLRSNQVPFDFRTQCFYCGCTVNPDDPMVFRCRQLGLKGT